MTSCAISTRSTQACTPDLQCVTTGWSTAHSIPSMLAIRSRALAPRGSAAAQSDWNAGALLLARAGYGDPRGQSGRNAAADRSGRSADCCGIAVRRPG